MICEGHDALRRALLKHMRLQPLDEMALALFVSVAVHIKSHKANISFAAQLGKSLKVPRRAFLVCVLNVCKKRPTRKHFASC